MWPVCGQCADGSPPACSREQLDFFILQTNKKSSRKTKNSCAVQVLLPSIRYVKESFKNCKLKWAKGKGRGCGVQGLQFFVFTPETNVMLAAKFASPFYIVVCVFD